MTLIASIWSFKYLQEDFGACIRCSSPFRPALQKAGATGLAPGPGNQATKAQDLSTWQQALQTLPCRVPNTTAGSLTAPLP